MGGKLPNPHLWIFNDTGLDEEIYNSPAWDLPGRKPKIKRVPGRAARGRAFLLPI